MRIGYLQFQPKTGKPKENIEKIIKLLEPVDAELIVIPELATTGYTFESKDELTDIAEPFDKSPSLDALQETAKKKECALVAGFAEKTKRGFFNSCALLRPDGSRELYRKIHLFGMENLLFEPGDIPFAVHEAAGAKIGMMICFDWYYPESARVLALKGAEIICHPVNFILPWGQRAMIIRCLENRVFAVTANRYGAESTSKFTNTFTGASQIVNPWGKIVSRADEKGDCVEVMEIDPSAASDKAINKYNDLFAGRRPEMYSSDLT